ncbi:MAG: PspC domain-containing protein [Planctomycetota bacterium]
MERENEPLEEPTLPPVDDPTEATPPLLTVREGALFAGLLAGVARRFGFDAVLLRVPVAALLVLGLVFWPPLFIALFALYVFLWLCIPQEDPSPLER